MFSSISTFYTGLQTDVEPANLEVKLEESPRSSVMLTPVSEVSSVELVSLSPPQISPSSQLSETASDISATEATEEPEAPEAPEAAEATEATEAAEASGLTAETCSHADSSSTSGEPQTDEDKEPKKSKAHLHCPVCKVTVNSISQLEAHNSGKRLFWTFWYSERHMNACSNDLFCSTTDHSQLCALSTRYKAQTNAGRSECSAPTPGESGSSSRRVQKQAAGQQRQRRGAQQELPVWSVWDLCELWDPAEPGKIHCWGCNCTSSYRRRL